MAYPTLNVKTPAELWEKLTQTIEARPPPPTTAFECEAYTQRDSDDKKFVVTLVVAGVAAGFGLIILTTLLQRLLI